MIQEQGSDMNCPDPAIVAGADCGGSRSRLMFAEYRGSRLSNTRLFGGEAASLAEIGPAALGRLLLELIGEVKCAALVVGAAGAGASGPRLRLESILRAALPQTVIKVVPDCELVLRSAFGDGPGIAIVAGTGSVAFARSGDGFIRAGGFGPLAGDGGGGYWMGRRLLRALGRSFDGIEPEPRPATRFRKDQGIDDLEDFLAWLRGPGRRRSKVASIARYVLDALYEDDEWAKTLCARGALRLAELAGSLKSRGARARAVLAGGLLEGSAAYRELVRSACLARASLSRVEVCPHPPVREALNWARDLFDLSGRQYGASVVRAVSAAVSPGSGAQNFGPGAPGETVVLDTERVNPLTTDFDRLTVAEMLEVMNKEDARTVTAVRAVLDRIAVAVELVVDALSNGGRLFYAGAGTSGRLAVLDAAECPPTFHTEPDMVQAVIAGGGPALVRAVEGAEDSSEDGALAMTERGLCSKDVLVGISCSGTAPFVGGALKSARDAGAATVLVACVEDPVLLELADVAVLPLPGPEVIAGSTRLKGGTVTKMILNMISTTAMVRLGKVYGNLMVDVNVANKKLRKRAVHLVKILTGRDETASMDLLGRSGWSVKTAVLMARLGVEYGEALERLRENKGFLRRALGENVPGDGCSCGESLLRPVAGEGLGGPEE